MKKYPQMVLQPMYQMPKLQNEAASDQGANGSWTSIRECEGEKHYHSEEEKNNRLRKEQSTKKSEVVLEHTEFSRINNNRREGGDYSWDSYDD